MIPTRNFTDKITYYFGAGASANAIPMVGQIIDRLNDFKSFLKNYRSNNGKNAFDFPNGMHFKEFLTICLKWSNMVKISPSIDTLAKRYSDQGSPKDYIEYKMFLVVLFNYFHYPKKTNEGIDYFSNELEGRYENLIRSINHFGLVSHYPFYIPQIFSFISWNYDFQLEQTIVKR